MDGISSHLDGISWSCRWDKQVMWMGQAGYVDGIIRSMGWDEEIQQIFLPKNQLVFSDNFSGRANANLPSFNYPYSLYLYIDI